MSGVATMEDHSTQADRALARAVVYAALAIAFQPPTRERLRRIGAQHRFSTVALALRLAGGRDPDQGLSAVAANLERLTTPPVARLAADFTRLFGHTTRGPVCACETEYGADNTYHQPQQLADIAGYYLAFGLQSGSASDVRADHVACECEFMDFMNRKEALFLELRPDETETLEVTREASRRFLRDHLARFGRAFASQLALADHDGFYGTMAVTLGQLLEHECRRLAVAAGPLDLPVRPEAPDDAPMACGDAAAQGSELIQIRGRQ
jgi:TorA maturation chaperone TorD